MRRLACLAATGFLLCGCHYASSPLSGFGGFIGDTHGFRSNPNLPPGNAENVRRVEGQQVTAEPLSPEPGNIWPGPPTAEPTLEDVIHDEQPDQMNAPQSGQAPAPTVPYGSSAHPQPRPNGSGGTPPAVDLRSQPNAPAVTPTPPNGITVPPPTVNTRNGAQPLNRDSNGVTTTTTPGGGTSIIVPNGNGTSTVIGPDGSTQTIPTPR